MLQPGLQCHAFLVKMGRNFDMKHRHLPSLTFFDQVFVRAMKLYYKEASVCSSKVKLCVQRTVNSALLQSVCGYHRTQFKGFTNLQIHK